MDGLQRLQIAQGIIKRLMSLISQIERYQSEKEKLRRNLMSEKNARLITEMDALITRKESERTALERELADQLEEFNEWARRVGFSLTLGEFNIARVHHREYNLGDLLAKLDLAVIDTLKFLG